MSYFNKNELNESFRYDNGILYWKNVYKKYCVKVGDIAGYLNTNGYIMLRYNGRNTNIHRVIYIMHYGEIPKGYQIDHINGIKTDNRIENLRLATTSENNTNKQAYKSNQLGYKGIYHEKKYNKYQVSITIKGKSFFLGQFNTLDEARSVYKQASLLHHKEFSIFYKCEESK